MSWNCIRDSFEFMLIVFYIINSIFLLLISELCILYLKSYKNLKKYFLTCLILLTNCYHYLSIASNYVLSHASCIEDRVFQRFLYS